MKRLPYCLFLFLLSAFPLALMGQTSLTLIDAESGEAIPSAIANLDNGTKHISDERGQISLDLAEKTNALFTHISYEPFRGIIIPDSAATIKLIKKTNSLSAVTVTSFESERGLMEQAAAVSKVDQAELYRFNETAIVHALNTKPGIRLEQRAPGSYRVSIRGSSLRAPFGVRNVKIYWDGIPFTAPDGTTDRKSVV